eukprot:366503-Chlamydomonas_euryale.AAC.16
MACMAMAAAVRGSTAARDQALRGTAGASAGRAAAAEKAQQNRRKKDQPSTAHTIPSLIQALG